MTSAWNILGLPPGADERSVKRAYAALLKKTRPEDDAVAYQALREAYEHALAVARHAGAIVVEPVAARPAAADAAMTETMAGTVAETVDETVAADSIAAVTIAAEAAKQAMPAEPAVTGISAAAVSANGPFAVPPANHFALASAALQDWLTQPGGNWRLRLRQQLRGEVLTDLRTREAFEVLAARHCAQAECAEAVRTAIVDELGWADDCAHLARLDPQAIGMALARRRADHSFNTLRARQSSEPAIGFLLSGYKPRLVLQMADARFVQRMRDALDEIRWQHEEMRRFRLNGEVVAEWERKIAAKRYTVQTFLLSLLGGFVLTFVMQALFNADRPTRDLIAQICYGLTIGGMAVYAFCTAVPLRTRVARLYEQAFDRRTLAIHGEMLRRCWAGVFALTSLLLFVDSPGLALKLATPLMLGLCVVSGLLLLAPVLDVSIGVFIAIQSMLLGSFLAFGGFGSKSLLNCCLAAVCLSVLRITSEVYVAAQRERFGRHAALIPAGWLAGCVALMAAMGSDLSGTLALAMLSWLWAIAGILVVSFSVNVFAVVATFFVLRHALHAAHLLPDMPIDSHMRVLQTMLLAISLYAARTMYLSARDTSAQETTPPVF